MSQNEISANMPKPPQNVGSSGCSSTNYIPNSAQDKCADTLSNSLFDYGVQPQIESIGIFSSFTPEAQKGIIDTLNNCSYTNRDIYDNNGLLTDDLSALEEIMLEEESSAVRLYSMSNGYTRVEIDEDGDGKTDRVGIYDKGGVKAEEHIDSNHNGTSETVITYDEFGNPNGVVFKDDKTNKTKYEEYHKEIDGSEFIDITEHSVNPDGRNQTVQYKDGERNYVSVDYEGDGEVDYERGVFVHPDMPHTSSKSK